MARCARCNKFMLFSSQAGYCNECIMFVMNQEKEARKKAEEEAARKADELRRYQVAEAHRKAEEEQKRQEEARLKAEEEQKRQEEARLKAEEEQKRQEEARLKAEEEQKRQEEARLKAEEEQNRQEEARLKAEEEQRRQEEARLKAEEEQKQQEAAQLKAEEQIKDESFNPANMTEEAWKKEFSDKAKKLLIEAQQRFVDEDYDNELLQILRHVMIYAEDGTIEWQQANNLHEETKQKIHEEDERKQKAEAERVLQEKKNRMNNMNGIHIGLIDTDGFYDSRDNLRNYTFITMIDGYKKIMYWNEDDEDSISADKMAEYDNENWVDDEDEENFKIIKQVFFHINDKGKGNIKTALEAIRNEERWNVRRGVGVVFKIASSQRGKKAVNVITIEDALSQNGMLENIKSMAQSDANVYFFLMQQVPDMFMSLLSGCVCEKVWKYEEHSDSIELTGVNFALESRYIYRMDYPSKYIDYFPCETIVIPDYISGKPVTNISKSAFAHINGIEKIIIPETVSFIGECAFEDCSVREIKLPSSIKTINARTFAECSSLRIVILPDQLMSIAEMAFSGCGIEEITIPASVKSINDSAFSNCEAIIKRRLK